MPGKRGFIDRIFSCSIRLSDRWWVIGVDLKSCIRHKKLPKAGGFFKKGLF
jgi:hypothetical protein